VKAGESTPVRAVTVFRLRLRLLGSYTRAPFALVSSSLAYQSLAYAYAHANSGSAHTRLLFIGANALRPLFVPHTLGSGLASSVYFLFPFFHSWIGLGILVYPNIGAIELRPFFCRIPGFRLYHHLYCTFS